MTTSRRDFLGNSMRAAIGLAIAPTFATFIQSCTKEDISGPRGKWADLARSLNGSLVMRDDLDFTRLNTQYALAYLSVVPQAIALCKSEADVVACVKWARLHNIPIAPRSGGHSYAGFSRTTGLLIDLSQMTDIQFDANSNIATLAGGVHNQEVYLAGRNFSTSLTHGRCKGVGVAGLVLGGGIGFNMRGHGLTCDQLLSTRIVLANGDVITASATENPEAFWAVRGAGGGNFGIHTQFAFQMFPVGNVVFFNMQWQDNLNEIFDAFQDIAATAPNTLGVKFSVIARKTFSGNSITIDILGQFVGSETELLALLKPLYDIADPLVETIEILPYWDAQELLSIDGNPEYAHERSRFAFGKISKEGREAIFRNLENWPGTSIDGQWKFFLMGGKIKEISGDDTAFLFREATMITSIEIEWLTRDEGLLSANYAWLDAFHAEMEQFTSRHCYINFIDNRQQNHLDAYYGYHIDRLKAVKRQLDPNNVFSNPQSIPV